MENLVITASDVTDLRAQAESELTDVCRISAPGSGERVFNETTLQYDEPDRVTIYGPGIAPHHGRCRFQIKADINSNIVETTAGEREATYTTSQLQLPVTPAFDIPVDSVVESLAASFNPNLPGRVFNVHGEIGPKSKPVIRRLRLREVAA